jgi:hypothetical protein
MKGWIIFYRGKNNVYAGVDNAYAGVAPIEVNGVEPKYHKYYQVSNHSF